MQIQMGNMSDDQNEAKDKWGHTEAYQIAAQRTASYTAADWEQIRTEAAEIYQLFYQHRQTTPDTPVLQQVVERWRVHLERWFYPCDGQMLQSLADLYENDLRFQHNIDKIGGNGTAGTMVSAIRHYMVTPLSD